MRTIITAIVLLLSFSTVKSYANIFEELDTEQRQNVLNGLKEHLPEMIEDDGLKDYVDFMTANIPQFATNLGELSGGNYTPIISQSLTLGGDALADYFADSLPDGPGKETFSYLYDKTGSFRNIGLAIMDERNSWGDVRDTVWTEIKTSIQSDLNDLAGETAKDAFNWVVGGEKTLGFTSADIYLAAIQLEAIFLDVETRRYRTEKINDFYLPYYELRNNGESHANAWNTSHREESSYTGEGFFVERNMPPIPGQQLEQLFQRCYDQRDYAGNSIYAADFNRFLNHEFEKATSGAKQEMANALIQPGTKFRHDINTFYGKTREKLNELIDKEIEKDRELTKRYQEALEQAGILLDKIEIDDEKRFPACDEYHRQQEKKLSALRKAKEGEQLVKRLKELLDDLEQCPEIVRESKRINTERSRLTTLLTESETLLEELKQLTKKICDTAHKITKSDTESAARQQLNQAIALGKTGKKISGRARNLEKEIAALFASLPNELAAFNRNYKGTDSSVQLNLENKMQEARALIDSLEQLQEAEEAFNEATKRLASSRIKAVNLSLSLNKKYMELNTLLDDFRGATKADSILAAAAEHQANISRCDEENHYSVEQERDRLRSEGSLGATVREFLPDLFNPAPRAPAADDAPLDKWPELDVKGGTQRFANVSKACNLKEGVVDGVEMLLDLSLMQSEGGDGSALDLYENKMKTCVGGSLTVFNEKFLNKDREESRDAALSNAERLKNAENICEKRLPGSLPMLNEDKTLYLAGNSPDGIGCLCPDGFVEFKGRCTSCSSLKKRFDKAIDDRNTQLAQHILDRSFHCTWVQNRENIGGLTDHEFCPDEDSIILSDETNEFHCVSCDQLERDFNDALKKKDFDYGQSLLDLSADCAWVTAGQQKLEHTMPCPENSVKLADENNNSQCVPCTTLYYDFHDALKQGDFSYAESLLDLCQSCSWSAGGRSALRKSRTCPENTVKLSDQSGENQCVPCDSLYADFSTARQQGETDYANSLLELAAACSWTSHAGQQMRKERLQTELNEQCNQQIKGSYAGITGNTYNCFCGDGMLIYTDGYGNKSCQSCEQIRLRVNRALQQNNLNEVKGLLGGSQQCAWYAQAVQIVSNIEQQNHTRKEQQNIQEMMNYLNTFQQQLNEQNRWMNDYDNYSGARPAGPGSKTTKNRSDTCPGHSLYCVTTTTTNADGSPRPYKYPVQHGHALDQNKDGVCEICNKTYKNIPKVNSDYGGMKCRTSPW